MGGTPPVDPKQKARCLYEHIGPSCNQETLISDYNAARNPDARFTLGVRGFPRYASRPDKVKALSPSHRFTIAVHSPGRFVETGLLGRPPEKKPAKLLNSNY
jgi:hypothetical protein